MARKMTTEVRGDIVSTVVEVTGEVDIETAPALKDVVVEAADTGPDRLVFDLSGVTFMDSTGLAVLVLARKKMLLRRGSVHLVAPTRRVLAILKLSGLDQVFRVHPSLAAARLDDDPAEPA